MKNFTGKVTDVDNNGNPIKKKSSGKNGKKSGFKKPAAAKKSSGKKPLKDITAVMTKKPVRKTGIIKESPLRRSCPQGRFFDVWEIA